MLDDRLSKLLEDSVHVRALSRPQALEETDMAAVTGDEQGQVGILLHRLHGNGWKAKNRTIKIVAKIRSSDCTENMAWPHHEKGKRRRQQRSDTALAPAQISACGQDWHRGSSHHW